HNPKHLAVQLLELAPKRSSRLQHRARDPLQHCLAGGQFSHPRLKSLARHNTHLQSKSPQDPGMLASRSISFESSCLRATSNARTSREPPDLACTGRNHPMRMSWAIPRASLRSVFIDIAESAALTCRVSKRTVSNPARLRPACNH